MNMHKYNTIGVLMLNKAQGKVYISVYCLSFFLHHSFHLVQISCLWLSLKNVNFTLPTGPLPTLLAK